MNPDRRALSAAARPALSKVHGPGVLVDEARVVFGLFGGLAVLALFGLALFVVLGVVLPEPLGGVAIEALLRLFGLPCWGRLDVHG